MQNNRLKLVIMSVLAALGFSNAFATDPATVAEMVTAVNALSGSTITAYIAFAVLGLGILTISLIVYVARRGTRLK
jgi:hypothetical protein